ncbi:MAG: ATP-binding cassette domain-containing protein [Cypionkella sp.]
MPPEPALLEVHNLCTEFGHGDHAIRAVNNVSFSLAKGEVLGLVGESGSGKSVTLRSILGLTRRYGRLQGQVFWQGQDLLLLAERQFQKVRGRDIAMIFPRTDDLAESAADSGGSNHGIAEGPYRSDGG